MSSLELWQSPPENLTLCEREISVWRVSLDVSESAIASFREILSEDEIKRADRYYFERDRNHFIAGRGFLRSLLSRYLSTSPQSLSFVYNPKGKPALVGNELAFNVSHSNGLALYAIALNPPNSPPLQLGIDLEYIRSISDADQLAKRFFTQREFEVISELRSPEKEAAFFRAWTAKEAYLKATSEGISGLDQVEIELGDAIALQSIQGNSQVTVNWSLYELYPHSNYSAALAIKGKDFELNYFHINN